MHSREEFLNVEDLGEFANLITCIGVVWPVEIARHDLHFDDAEITETVQKFKNKWWLLTVCV